MQTPLPHVREAGAGSDVVCLHANASSSSQWRTLMELLAPRFHVLAPDSYGSGRSPAWTADRLLTLHDEVQLLSPLLQRAGTPVVLVGHSYGAAVALIAALDKTLPVRALALYEPTLFALLDQTAVDDAAAGIRAVAATAGAAIDAGDADGAARCFIDYWIGSGSWARMPDARKAPILASIVNIRGWAHALFHEPTALAALASLDMPVLLMTGTASPVSSLAVSRRLRATLPNLQNITFESIGHMGPVTHSALINGAIANFLQRL